MIINLKETNSTLKELLHDWLVHLFITPITGPYIRYETWELICEWQNYSFVSPKHIKSVVTNNEKETKKNC